MSTENSTATESTEAKKAPPAKAKPAAKKAAPAKKAAAKKAAKPSKAKGGAKRSDAWSAKAIGPIDGKKIKLLVKENPKRGKSAKRFGIYKNGMTVEQFVEKGGYRADIRYDVAHKFISIH